MKFLEERIYRLSLFLLAWSLLRFDRRHGGKHQNLMSGCTLVKVSGKEYWLRWLLSSAHIPSDASSRYEQLLRRIDRAEKLDKFAP